MFLKNPSLLWKSTTFRLITLYTIIFIASSAFINFYAYKSISSFIYKESRGDIEEDIEEYVALYNEFGIEGLKKEVYDDDDEPYLVVFTGNQKDVRISRIPKLFEGSYISRLEMLSSSTFNKWISVKGDEGDSKFEIKSLPLSDGSILQVGQNVSERENLLRQLRRIYALTLIPLVIVAYIGGLFVADRALNPIRELIGSLKRIIKSGEIDERITISEADDINKEMITTFNTMLERIGNLISGIRNSLDNIAHDLRIPMTRFRGTAEMALLNEYQTAENLQHALENCLEESDRILTIFDTLMDISEAEAGAMKLNKELVDVNKLIDEIIELYDLVAQNKDVSISKNLTDNLSIVLDRNKIRQVLVNLIDNAIKYTPHGGSVNVSSFKEENYVVIAVKDTGMGIPKNEQSIIWDRLYRGDRSRSQKGHGLGLSLVKAVVEAHGGHVNVISEPEDGALFSIHLSYKNQ